MSDIELKNQEAMLSRVAASAASNPAILRDSFAIAALQGFMANKEIKTVFDPDDDAAYCYKIADAMLAAREKLQKGRSHERREAYAHTLGNSAGFYGR